MRKMFRLDTRKLRELRKRAGYTPAELAELLDVTSRTITAWEAGNSLPSFYNQRRLAKLFCIKPAALLVEEDPDAP